MYPQIIYYSKYGPTREIVHNIGKKMGVDNNLHIRSRIAFGNFIFGKRGSDDKHRFPGVPSNDPLKSVGRTQCI